MDITKATTNYLYEVMEGRESAEDFDAVVKEYEDRSTKLNVKLKEEGVLLLTPEESANGDYKALSPDFNSFNFSPKEGDDWGCRVMPLRYHDDASYIASECT